jgi:hypothetical protein
MTFVLPRKAPSWCQKIILSAIAQAASIIGAGHSGRDKNGLWYDSGVAILVGRILVGAISVALFGKRRCVRA